MCAHLFIEILNANCKINKNVCGVGSTSSLALKKAASESLSLTSKILFKDLVLSGRREKYTCTYSRAVLCWDKPALWGDRCYLCFNFQQSDSVGETAVYCTVNGITINSRNRFSYLCAVGVFFFLSFSHPSLPSVNFSQLCDGLLDQLCILITAVTSQGYHRLKKSTGYNRRLENKPRIFSACIERKAFTDYLYLRV